MDKLTKSIVDNYSCRCKFLDTTPVISKGYVVNKHYKILFCENCGDCFMVTNKFWTWMFKHFASKRWDGTIYITDKNDEVLGTNVTEYIEVITNDDENKNKEK